MKIIHVYTISIISILLLLFPQFSYAQFFKAIGMEDGLSNLSVLSIYQDTLGRMWFGTNEGVNIYDGTRIEKHKVYEVGDGNARKTVFMDGPVYEIVGDAHGDVFMNAGNALIKYDIKEEKLQEIRAMGVGTIKVLDGDLWYTVKDSLFRYTRCEYGGGHVDSLHAYKLGTPDITALVREDGRLWIGTDKGLYLQEGTEVKCVIPGAEIYRLFLSSRGELWIGSRMDGLWKRGRDGVIRKEKQGPQRVASNQIRDFVEDDRQYIWFGTFDGLYMYNPYADEYRVYRPDKSPGSITHQSVFSLYRDRQGTIWAGSYYGGINYFNWKKDIFQFYSYDMSNSSCLDFPIVGQILEDSRHNLWIATDGGGLNYLHRKSGLFTYYTTDASGNSILHNNVKSIAYDEQHDRLYIGTYTGGLSVYDNKRGTFYNYLPHYRQTGEGPGDIIFNLQFVENRLYITAKNGFWRLNPDTQQFEMLNKSRSTFQVFRVDSRGILWVADSKRLYQMKVSEPEKLKRIRLGDLEEVKVTAITEAKDGTVYITTLGEGVFAYSAKAGEWKHFTAKDNYLLSDFCYNVVETPMNHILVTCDGGFSIYSPFNQSVYFVTLGAYPGRISAVAEGCGLYVSEDDLVYVGGVDGMISFNEKDLYQQDDDNAGLYFSTLYVNNVKVVPHDEHQVLREALPFVDHIRLASGQNNLTVDFRSSDYVKRDLNIRYQYKLEGFDSDWFFTQGSSLVYTNLRPGDYVLKVREAGDAPAGVAPREIALGITVVAPWYVTGWAFLLYSVALASVFFVWGRIRRSRRLLALSLQKEKDEKERIAEINRAKLRFFTNISHEFRTPLTLVIGQLDILLQQEQLSSVVRNRLQRVYKSAMNLLFLITELLDFRKQEQGFLKLKVECLDFGGFVKGIYDQFAEIAREKQMTYTWDYPEEVKAWFDPLQMQKVVFNILSNAFKYTPQGRSIRVSIKRVHEEVVLSVADTGCGIPQEAQAKIFERFYQVDETSKEGVLGSGIGLALTKGIVETHHGSISVQSRPGEGSTFSVRLKLGNAHFTKEELEHGQMGVPDNGWSQLWTDLPAKLPTEGASCQESEYSDASESDKPTILIVEDDEDMAEMLQTLFATSYKVYRAADGKQGFEMACDLHPDLVLSDVMMPVMSGKELCYKIKNCLELAYTPVVLLTAQVSEENTMEGYVFGADDYVAKPFNAKLLLVRCANLLKNKRRLLEAYNKQSVDSLVQNAGKDTVDGEVVRKAAQIIRQHMENPDFGMKQLADELQMGRTKMFTCLKDATGLTPNEFVLKIKLEEGLRLLKEHPQYNISEISYRLGFSSPRYFSRCFKDFYGVSPKTYRKKDFEE